MYKGWIRSSHYIDRYVEIKRAANGLGRPSNRCDDRQYNWQKEFYIKSFRSMAEDSIRAMAEGPDSIFFFASHDNLLTYSPISDIPAYGWPPFVFPPKGKPFDRVSSLYIDNSGDLFIGTHADNFYWIKKEPISKALKMPKIRL